MIVTLDFHEKKFDSYIYSYSQILTSLFSWCILEGWMINFKIELDNNFKIMNGTLFVKG
jgi:hypothetical protein